MGRHAKLLEHIPLKRGDADVDFEDLRQSLLWLGFQERVRVSRRKEGIVDKIDLQRDEAKAKALPGQAGTYVNFYRVTIFCGTPRMTEASRRTARCAQSFAARHCLCPGRIRRAAQRSQSVAQGVVRAAKVGLDV